MKTVTERVMIDYMDVRVDVAIKSFNMVSTLTCELSNLQVLFPWMPGTKAAVSRFPSSKICLQYRSGALIY
jgi:hypothetical protein